MGQVDLFLLISGTLLIFMALVFAKLRNADQKVLTSLLLILTSFLILLGISPLQ